MSDTNMNASEGNDDSIDLFAIYKHKPFLPFDKEKMVADARAAIARDETGDDDDVDDAAVSASIVHAEDDAEVSESITFDDDDETDDGEETDDAGSDDADGDDANGEADADDADGDNEAKDDADGDKTDDVEDSSSLAPSDENAGTDDGNDDGVDASDGKGEDLDDASDGNGDGWDDDSMSVILDKATMGAVKRNDTLFFWQIEGLLKDNGTQYSWMHLRDNPPKLVFKRPNEEPFIVILGKTEANQLAAALERVCRAYNAVPIDDQKKEHFTRKNWKRKIREMFEDNPIGFVAKIAATVFVVGIVIAASIMSLA